MGTSIVHYIPYDLLLQDGATATANGTEMELNSKYGTLVVQVMGITSATITFEAVRSGHKADAYAAIAGANRATGAFGSTATANGSYIFDVRGIKKFRARISTYVSGTIFAHATATAQDAGMTPIPDIKVTWSTPVAVNVTTASTQLLAANANRVAAQWQNISDVFIDTSVNVPAVVGQGLFRAAPGTATHPGGAYFMSAATGDLDTRAINAIHSGVGNKVMMVSEAVRA